MINRMVLIFIIAHLLGDFVFQSVKVVELRFSKNKCKRLKGNIKHMITHMVVIVGLYALLFGSINYPIITLIKTTVMISISHIVIDVIKSEIKVHSEICNRINGMVLFIADQFLHVLFIIMIFTNFQFSMIGETIKSLCEYYPYNLDILDRLLILVIIVISTTFAVGTLIRIKFEKNDELKTVDQVINNNELDFKGMKNGGLIIGYMERLFIMSLVSIGQASMIGFVLATKTIVRFKKLDQDRFAEYFIVGTFISYLFALMGGLLIYSLNIIPVIK